MSGRRFLFACVFSGLLGGLIGVAASIRYYSRASVENEVGTTAVATINDLGLIANLDANESDKAKLRIEQLLVQDIDLFLLHSTDTGASGQTSREVLQRIVKWREQHPAIIVAPNLEQGFRKATAKLS